MIETAAIIMSRANHATCHKHTATHGVRESALRLSSLFFEIAIDQSINGPGLVRTSVEYPDNNSEHK